MPAIADPGRRIAAVVAATALAVAACTPVAPSTAPTAIAATPAPPTTAATAPPTAAVTPAPTAAFARNPAPFVDGAPYEVSIVPAAFVEGISNPFLPFVRGASFVFDGDEHVEVKVLPETKQILGVAATVVSDKVFQDGELIEDTLDYYAQDVDGNVWYFGEKTAEYENGVVSSTAGSWEGGVDGALPGIVMLADPHVGDQYRQEFYAGEAEDLGAVTALGGSVTVPAGSWSGADVVVTEEWTPLEPDVREQKTYGRGAGIVETRTIKGGNEVDTLTSLTIPGQVGATSSLGPAEALVALPLLWFAALASRIRGRRRLG